MTTATDPTADLIGTVRRSPSRKSIAVLWPSPPHPARWMVTDQWGSTGYEVDAVVADWTVVGPVPFSPAAGFALDGSVPNPPPHSPYVSDLPQARAAHSAALDRLVEAVEADLLHTVEQEYPEPGWLVADVEPWIADASGESNLDLRAVVALDGTVLYQYDPAEEKPKPAWHTKTEDLLTELANRDGDSSWPDLCRVINWSCDLRSVALLGEDGCCEYPHDGHEPVE